MNLAISGIDTAVLAVYLLGNQRVLDPILAGKTITQIRAIYQPALEDFKRRRSRFLLYER